MNFSGMTDQQIIDAQTDNCGCVKLPGQVGNHGWHFWIVTREYLETVQKILWRREHPIRDYREFKYDPSNEAIYLGQLEAAERCPAYVAVTAKSKPIAKDDRKEKRSRS